VRAHRDRAAAHGPGFLRDIAARDLLDRLFTVSRTFERAVELGGAGAFARLYARDTEAQTKIAWLASADLSPALMRDAPDPYAGPSLGLDEERLALADASVDLIVSPLSLHWVNDLPGALIQIRRALKPDGVFLGAMLGGATLTELRVCLLAAETELTGGANARVSPFADTQDLAGLLQRAGFALPVADTDTLTATYADPLALMRELRAMGETSAPATPASRPLTRAVLARALEIYAARFSAPDGRATATFEILSVIGWAPHPDQPVPKRPGSATARLADALGTTEQSAGEPTPGARVGPSQTPSKT